MTEYLHVSNTRSICWGFVGAFCLTGGFVAGPAGVEARREEEALGVLQEMIEKGLTVEAENLMALKFACESNAYDGCVVLVDQLLMGAVSESQLQASALGFGEFS